jgi:hypothetical protein
MLSEKAVMRTETVFSDDRTHRYLLRKEWDSKKPRATIIMTNPSTADILAIDYTTLYILNNLVKLDYGAVDVVNLISKTTTKMRVKEDLNEVMDPVNLDYIVKSAEKSDKVIVAWGKLGENNKKVRDLQDNLLEHLKPFQDRLCEIADTEGRSGFHPLAHQIRFSWALKKFVIPPKEDLKEKAPSKDEVSLKSFVKGG